MSVRTPMSVCMSVCLVCISGGLLDPFFGNVCLNVLFVCYQSIGVSDIPCLKVYLYLYVVFVYTFCVCFAPCMSASVRMQVYQI